MKSRRIALRITFAMLFQLQSSPVVAESSTPPAMPPVSVMATAPITGPTIPTGAGTSGQALPPFNPPPDGGFGAPCSTKEETGDFAIELQYCCRSHAVFVSADVGVAGGAAAAGLFRTCDLNFYKPENVDPSAPCRATCNCNGGNFSGDLKNPDGTTIVGDGTTHEHALNFCSDLGVNLPQ